MHYTLNFATIDREMHNVIIKLKPIHEKLQKCKYSGILYFITPRESDYYVTSLPSIILQIVRRYLQKFILHLGWKILRY